MKKKKLVSLVLFIISVLYIIICLNTIDVDEDIMSQVSRIQSWPHGIKFARWKDHDISSNDNYNHDWVKIFRGLYLDPDCNAVDIGAQIGDTTLNLADIFPNGKVVAFEMGPPMDILRLNVRLNPQFDIDVHNVAVSNHTGNVFYNSGNNGANGGIKPTGSLSVPSVRLYPFLQSQYSQQTLANICVLKIDTEGHDVVILSDLPAQFRPPVVWVEWFREYQFADIKDLILEDSDYCTEESARLFQTIISLGYEIFQPGWPLTKQTGCANKFWVEDLLLVRRDFLLELIRDHEEMKRMKKIKWEYEIQVMDDDDFEVIPRGYYDWSDRKNSPAYHGVSG